MAGSMSGAGGRIGAVGDRRSADARVREEARIIAGRLSSRFTTDVVRKARAKGLKHKDLARAMGISAPALTKDLRSRNLTFETAARMALALDGELAVVHDGLTIFADTVSEIREVEDAAQVEGATLEVKGVATPTPSRWAKISSLSFVTVEG